MCHLNYPLTSKEILMSMKLSFNHPIVREVEPNPQFFTVISFNSDFIENKTSLRFYLTISKYKGNLSDCTGFRAVSSYCTGLSY